METKNALLTGRSNCKTPFGSMEPNGVLLKDGMGGIHGDADGRYRI